MNISNLNIFEKSIFPQHRGILSEKKYLKMWRGGLINYYHAPGASSPIFL